MNTVDMLLADVIATNFYSDISKWESRDIKILRSLDSQVKKGHFLTENQGNLLIKILKENKENIKDCAELLDAPVWSQDFRILNSYKKITLSNDLNPEILMDFSFNKKIKERLHSISKQLELSSSTTTSQLRFVLTEKNVYLLVSNFKEFDFDIDKKILNYYQEIEEILKNNLNYFEIFSSKNDNMLKRISHDIGEISHDNLLLLMDRRHRYHYRVNYELTVNSLTSAIANRKNIRIWINPEKYSFDDIIQSLKDLKRLPLLLIYDSYNSSSSVNYTLALDRSLKKHDITNDVGIYFRMDSVSDENKEFNELIKKFGYNANLDSTTQVAGISNKTLPKFMLNSDWYPKSAIAFTPSFRSNKTHVYCDAVDLIIYYTESQPLLGNVDVIM